MSLKNVSRRSFLRSTTVGASAVALSTTGVARGFPANEKVQLGWIGIGGRARGLLTDVLQNCPDARTAAVCDLIPDRVEAGQKMAERDKPNGYTDFRQMLEKEKLDGVLVITQPCAHADVVVPVLEAGFHCFAEKPMDITVEKVDAIAAAARKARKDKGAIYQIGTQRRYNPGYLTGIKAIHDGRIGKVTFLQGQWHWPWKVGQAKVDRDGGRFIEQASHHTDVMTWAMKDQNPVVCVSIGYSQVNPPEGPNVYSETHSATAFKFPEGQIFSYTHLFYLPNKFIEEKLWVFGETGGVDLNQALLYDMGTTEKSERVGQASGADWGKGTTEELQDFVANVKTGAKRLPNANVESGRVSTLMCIMARMAMVNAAKNAYESRVVKWEDLGSKT